MRTEASVDLLRTMLADRGHILPTVTHRESACRILNHGEYLVSLMSHDDQLMEFLNSVVTKDGYFCGHLVATRINRVNIADGATSVSWMMYEEPFGRDIDLWVDTVKFVWVTHGVVDALELIKGAGLFTWSNNKSVARRFKYIDGLVLAAQKKLRLSGLKHREMADFFADIHVSKDILGLH